MYLKLSPALSPPKVTGGLAVEATDVLAERLKFHVTHNYTASLLGSAKDEGAMTDVRGFSKRQLEKPIVTKSKQSCKVCNTFLLFP